MVHSVFSPTSSDELCDLSDDEWVRARCRSQLGAAASSHAALSSSLEHQPTGPSAPPSESPAAAPDPVGVVSASRDGESEPSAPPAPDHDRDVTIALALSTAAELYPVAFGDDAAYRLPEFQHLLLPVWKRTVCRRYMDMLNMFPGSTIFFLVVGDSSALAVPGSLIVACAPFYTYVNQMPPSPFGIAPAANWLKFRCSGYEHRRLQPLFIGHSDMPIEFDVRAWLSGSATMDVTVFIVPEARAESAFAAASVVIDSTGRVLGLAPAAGTTINASGAVVQILDMALFRLGFMYWECSELVMKDRELTQTGGGAKAFILAALQLKLLIRAVNVRGLYTTSTHDGMREFASSQRRIQVDHEPAPPIRAEKSTIREQPLASAFATQPDGEHIATGRCGTRRPTSSVHRAASEGADNINIVQQDSAARQGASVVVLYAAVEMVELPLHFLGDFNHILTFPVRLEGCDYHTVHDDRPLHSC